MKLNQNDVMKYYTVLEGAFPGNDPAKTLATVGEKPYFETHPELSFYEYSQALGTFTASVRHMTGKAAPDENVPTEEEADAAWQYLSDHTAPLLGQLEQEMNGHEYTSPDFRTVQQAYTVISLADDFVNNIRSAEAVHAEEAERAQTAEAMDIIARDREQRAAEPEDDGPEDDDEILGFGNPAVKEDSLYMKEYVSKLSAFSSSEVLDMPLKEGLEAFDQQIELIGERIPEEVRAEFADAVSFRDLDKKLEEADDAVQHTWAQMEDMKRNTGITDMLRGRGHSFEEALEISRYCNELFRNNIGNNGSVDVDALNRDMFDTFLKGDGRYRSNVPGAEAGMLFDTMSNLAKNYNETEKEMESRQQRLQQVKDVGNLMLAKQEKAVLISANQDEYDAMKQAEKAQNSPDEVLRKKLRTLSDQMGRMHKFGMNTTEFNTFRTALDRAAAGGDLTELQNAAQNYITRKTADGLPSTDSGIGRLNVAFTVRTLVGNALENGKAREEQMADPFVSEPQKNVGTGNSVEYDERNHLFTHFDNHGMDPKQEYMYRMNIRGGGNVPDYAFGRVSNILKGEGGMDELRRLCDAAQDKAQKNYERAKEHGMVADMPENWKIGDPEPVQNAPAENAPEQNAPEQNAPEQNVSEQNAPEAPQSESDRLIGKAEQLIGKEKMTDQMRDVIRSFGKEAEEARASLEKKCGESEMVDGGKEVDAMIRYNALKNSIEKGTFTKNSTIYYSLEKCKDNCSRLMKTDPAVDYLSSHAHNASVYRDKVLADGALDSLSASYEKKLDRTIQPALKGTPEQNKAFIEQMKRDRAAGIVRPVGFNTVGFRAGGGQQPENAKNASETVPASPEKKGMLPG